MINKGLTENKKSAGYIRGTRTKKVNFSLAIDTRFEHVLIQRFSDKQTLINEIRDHVRKCPAEMQPAAILQKFKFTQLYPDGCWMLKMDHGWRITVAFTRDKEGPIMVMYAFLSVHAERDHLYEEVVKAAKNGQYKIIIKNTKLDKCNKYRN